jgi:hypothetical protein
MKSFYVRSLGMKGDESALRTTSTSSRSSLIFFTTTQCVYAEALMEQTLGMVEDLRDTSLT